MEGRITYDTTSDGTLITIRNHLRPRVKWLFLIQFLMFSGSAAGAVVALLMSDVTQILSLLIMSGIAILYWMVGFSYLYRVTQKEEILVTPTHLTITETGAGLRKTKIYEVAQIADFHHMAPPNYTEHPLSGKSIDYLGFGARDRELQTVNSPRRISFFYAGKNISFGKDITTWEAEELGKVIHEITGNDLRFDDLYEKDILWQGPEESECGMYGSSEDA